MFRKQEEKKRKRGYKQETRNVKMAINVIKERRKGDGDITEGDRCRFRYDGRT